MLDDLAGSGPRPGTPGDVVGGVVPTVVARPRGEADAARVMAAAARHGLSVVSRGGGTALDWGAPPRSVDLLVETAALTGIEHTADDLVVTVGAGTPVAELTDVLGAAGQRLSADPVRVGGTVGGMVATGVCGPRRLLFGALRDLVIGMTVVRADGVLTRTGGRVVKNVAGYDLAKLHTGGQGTLGMITSVTFRLHPTPPALRVVTAAVSSRAHGERMAAALRARAVAPSAVALDWPSEGGAHLHVVLEGMAEGMTARVDGVRAALGGDTVVSERLPEGWGLVPARGTLGFVACPPAESLAAAERIGELVRAADADVLVRGSVPSGALHAVFPPGTGADVIATAAEGVRSRPGWSLTLMRAEQHVHEAGVDLWGEVPGLPLMRSVKDALDPRHRLAPGRFVGGI
ncbi:FAD-linked oxidase [Nocardiopsis sp. CNR-923]|nr:FAD-binding oxidoreductase [Nocardiopsis sp. CNR-923]OLT27488.1 FAD-linked oxidase [Nocardiopsis sp. CNR-923]